jgi:hypothetical protein
VRLSVPIGAISARRCSYYVTKSLVGLVLLAMARPSLRMLFVWQTNCPPNIGRDCRHTLLADSMRISLSGPKERIKETVEEIYIFLLSLA